MKIERISENQIRCTLSKHDLMERHLKISELAYGSDKAKELFRDMMEQANIDFGFDADDIPLMIEAIPTSRESIILVITKVENPEEFDERFSRFGLQQDEFDEEDEVGFDLDEVPEDDEAEAPELVNCFEQLYDLLEEAGAKSRSGEFVPLSESLQGQKKNTKKYKKKKTETIHESVRVFSFHSLNTIIELSHLIDSRYTAKNSIWKDPVRKTYYLLLNRGHGKAVFQATCSLISEFGKEETVTYATQAYFNEHFQMIIKDKALEQLSQI